MHYVLDVFPTNIHFCVFSTGNSWLDLRSWSPTWNSINLHFIHETYISFIFTHPEFRRVGIASFMLYHLFHMSINNNYSSSESNYFQMRAILRNSSHLLSLKSYSAWRMCHFLCPCIHEGTEVEIKLLLMRFPDSSICSLICSWLMPGRASGHHKLAPIPNTPIHNTLYIIHRYYPWIIYRQYPWIDNCHQVATGLQLVKLTLVKFQRRLVVTQGQTPNVQP